MVVYTCHSQLHKRLRSGGKWFQAGCAISISIEKSWVWWLTAVVSAMVGSVKQENCAPDWPGQKARLYLQNNQSIKGWRYDSSSRAPA
jgi:hypothetical protein